MHSKAYECKMPKRLIIYGGRSTEQTRSLMKPRGTVLSICLDATVWDTWILVRPKMLALAFNNSIMFIQLRKRHLIFEALWVLASMPPRPDEAHEAKAAAPRDATRPLDLESPHQIAISYSHWCPRFAAGDQLVYHKTLKVIYIFLSEAMLECGRFG